MKNLKKILITILAVILILGNQGNVYAANNATTIPDGQPIYIYNYVIGNVGSLSSYYYPTTTISARGYTAYNKTATSGSRWFSTSAGYDSSFQSFVANGRPYSDSQLPKNAFGATSSSECPVVENQYFSYGQVVKLSAVAKACGHTNQAQDLWVYVYQGDTLIDSYFQSCAPMQGASHHIDNVTFYYKINSSGNYTIKVKGLSRGCTNGYANGISVYPTIYTGSISETPVSQYTYTIKFNANGGNGTPSSITASGSDSSVTMGDIGSTVPTRDGYIFRGWSASSTYNNKRIAYSSSYGGETDKNGYSATTTSSSWSYADYCSYTGGSTSSRTLTLYAQWEPATAKYTVNHYAQNEDGTYTLVSTEEFEDTIGKTVTPDVCPQTGRNTPPKQSVVIAADGSTVVNYYYDVTRFDADGTVTWNDHENEYGTRPEDITVRLYLDGEEIDSIVVPAVNTSNKYSFKGLQKYDLTTGKELIYTVSQNTAYSQASGVDTEDKYTTEQDGFDFLNTIKNTDSDKPDAPEPDKPDDKGFHIGGNIYWEDNDDSLGFRPSEVTITLYQKGEDGEWKVFDSVVVDADPGNKGTPESNHYLFDWLPKYWYDENDEPTKYEYKVEETFTSWYEEDGVIKDAYTIVPDSPKDCDFTNIFNKPGKPIIPVNEYVNTLIVKTNTDEKVSVILKPQELFVNDDYSVSYGDFTGNNVPVLTDRTGNVIINLPSTRYEIVVDSPGWTIDDMDLTLENNMILEKIDGKWYITILNVPEDAIGTLDISLTKKTEYYQTRQRMSNYFAVFSEAMQKVMPISMMSDFVIEAGDMTDIPDDEGNITNDTDSSEWPETEDSEETDSSEILEEDSAEQDFSEQKEQAESEIEQ